MALHRRLKAFKKDWAGDRTGWGSEPAETASTDGTTDGHLRCTDTVPRDQVARMEEFEFEFEIEGSRRDVVVVVVV